MTKIISFLCLILSTDILKKFIENNYGNLVKNKSILAYSNFNQLDYVKDYFKNIQINKQYEIAICYF